ncbi:hypothetical protein G5C65_36455 [Streptomyces sp. SB3404]|uniref:Roadblock/LAMTOR2 domain-containing protein n=1 Tax=Streptomyces boncukensis TaxID=2711219 RepID=A0A6G4XA50_9ACTN|nr:hypothetical protein [Streptomyces boncukensis]
MEQEREREQEQAEQARADAAAPPQRRTPAAEAGTGTGTGRPAPPVRVPGASRPGGRGPRGSSSDLATIVSGVGSLTLGAAQVLDGGPVRQTMVSMDEGALFVMTIGDGSLLGVHAAPDCDMSAIGYHMALFVGRAGHVLTPELRSELRESRTREDGPDGARVSPRNR